MSVEATSVSEPLAGASNDSIASSSSSSSSSTVGGGGGGETKSAKAKRLASKSLRSVHDELLNVEFRLAKLTQPIGLVSDCLYGSVRSKRVMTLTFMLVAVLVIQIIILLFRTPATLKATIDFDIAPPRTAMLGTPLSNFSIIMQKGSNDPIVGAKLKASLVPLSPFPLVVHVEQQALNTTSSSSASSKSKNGGGTAASQATNSRSHILSWVDCVSLVAGAINQRNRQFLEYCEVDRHTAGSEAVSDETGTAYFNDLALRHGPSTNYLVVIEVMDFGHTKSYLPLTEQDRQIRKLEHVIKMTQPTVAFDIAEGATTFDNITYELTAEFQVKWTAPRSLSQSIFAGLHAVGNLVNASKVVDFKKLGLMDDKPYFNVNPKCTFMALDLEDLQDFSIAPLPSNFIWTAQLDDQKSTFTASQDSTNDEGSALVKISAKLNSYSVGFFNAISCLGLIRPIAPWNLKSTNQLFRVADTVVFPYFPKSQLVPGLEPRVESVSVAFTSGTEKVYAPDGIKYMEFTETDLVKATVTLTWKESATRWYLDQQNAGNSNAKLPDNQVVFCDLVPLPPNEAYQGALGDLYAQQKHKSLVNASVRIPMALEAGTGRLRGKADLNARFSLNGLPGVFIFDCMAENVGSSRQGSKVGDGSGGSSVGVFLVKTAVDVAKSAFVIAPQPWASSSSSSSGNNNNNVYDEILGEPWLSSPTMRLQTAQGTPLVGKRAAIISHDHVAVSFISSVSDSNGQLSFAHIKATSMGYEYYKIKPANQPRICRFSFIVDSVIVGNHTVRLHPNPKLGASAFCNTRILRFQGDAKKGLFNGVPFADLVGLVTDGFGRPISAMVKITVNKPLVMVCSLHTVENQWNGPETWGDYCPDPSSSQTVMSNQYGILNFTGQPGETAFAVAGVIEESNTAVFSLQCLRANTQPFDDLNTTTAPADMPKTARELSDRNYQVSASLITSVSNLVINVRGTWKHIRTDLDMNRMIPDNDGSGNYHSNYPYSYPLNITATTYPDFFVYAIKRAYAGIDPPVPATCLWPRSQYLMKPAGSQQMYPGSQPKFLVASIHTVDKNPNISAANIPNLNTDLRMTTYLMWSRDVSGLFVGTLSFDGSSRFLPSSIEVFGIPPTASRLEIVQPLRFHPFILTRAVTGIAAWVQPVVRIISKNSYWPEVGYARVYAEIRLWDIDKNEKIRDVNPFLVPNDIELGALVELEDKYAGYKRNGRPVSTFANETTGLVTWSKLTLAGIAPNSSFKVVYKLDLGENTVEVEQNTIFQGGIPAPIISCIPTPYAVGDVPNMVTCAQPFAFPMMLVPRCDSAGILNYDAESARILAKSQGGVRNDTWVSRPYFFSRAAITTLNSVNSAISNQASSITSNSIINSITQSAEIADEFAFTFPRTTPSGSYRVYVSYPGGRTTAIPILVVSDANSLAIEVQPPTNVTLNSPFSASVKVTAAGGMPLRGIAVATNLKLLGTCDSQTTYTTATTCGQLGGGGSSIALTDDSGVATVTLIINSGREGMYSLDFGVLNAGEDSLTALAQSSLSKLAEATGGMVNASHISGFGGQLASIISRAITASDPTTSSGSGGPLGLGTGLTAQLLGPLVSIFQSAGATSLPFKVWNPVSRIEIINTIQFGKIQGWHAASYSDIKDENDFKRGTPCARVLNRDGQTVANILVRVVQKPGAGPPIRLSGSENTTANDGTVCFTKLRYEGITGGAVSGGEVELIMSSLGVNTESPLNAASHVFTPNMTLLSPGQAEQVSLETQMQRVAFVSLAIMIPLFLANVRRSSIFWVILAACFQTAYFVAQTVLFAEAEKDWHHNRWFRPVYGVILTVLLGALAVSILWLVFKMFRHGKDAFENQTSSRVLRAYYYTRWLISVRRPDDERSIEKARKRVNDEIKSRWYYKAYMKIENYIPIELRLLETVDEFDQLPPIEIPQELEPVEVPNKYWIVIGIALIITGTMLLASYYITELIIATLRLWISYVPSSDKKYVISSSELTNGILNFRVTVQADQAAKIAQKGIVAILRLIAKTIPTLSFVNRFATVIAKFDLFSFLNTVIGTTSDVLDYLGMGQAASSGLALLSVIVMMIMMGQNMRKIMIESRRGLHKEDRKNAQWRYADQWVSFQAMLFALQHQLVFWVLFVLIATLVTMILTKTLMPVITPILVAALINVGTKLIMELAAIKFIRSFTDNVKNPVLLSIFSVFSGVVAIFGSLVGLVVRFGKGFAIICVTFCRSDLGLHPSVLSKVGDEAYRGFWATVSLENRYNHPLLLTSAAIMSVEAKITSMAREEQEELAKQKEEGVEKQNENDNNNNNNNNNNNKKFLVNPQEFGRTMSSVPTMASLVQHHTARIVSRWRKEVHNIEDAFYRNEKRQMEADKQALEKKVSELMTKKRRAIESGNNSAASLETINEELLSNPGSGNLNRVSSPVNISAMSTYLEKGDASGGSEGDEKNLPLPTASELDALQKTHQRYVRSARRFKLLILLHENPSLRRFRKKTLACENVETSAGSAASLSSLASPNSNYPYSPTNAASSSSPPPPPPTATSAATAAAGGGTGEAEGHKSESSATSKTETSTVTPTAATSGGNDEQPVSEYEKHDI